ncbi:putative response regulator protein VraR [Clostridiales bacterium oral taxon 876 str. F0540]|nr:putative response regulator protein VraR [Clostridiales bacterium oral taxon 876 str. F0540]
MKLLVVDDHPLVRKGLLSTLALEEGVEQIQEASNVEEAMIMLVKLNPDISMVDLRLGKEDGLEIVSRAKKKALKTKFIILTSSSRKEDFLKAQEAGVDGYLLKEAYTEDIIYALHVVSRGKKFFDAEMLQYKMSSSQKDTLYELTEREKDVLEELGKGLSNTQIAKKLYISENTVKKHISNILSKLGLNHRTEAALYINNYAS